MSQDVSGVNTVVQIVASITFPTGFGVTHFSDDADPLDFPAIKFADTAMGLNGDLIKWAKATILPMVLNVIPGSDDDLNLQILANANRVAKGRISSNDDITATVIYPDGSIVTLTGGAITDGQFGKSIASSARLKTKMYGFSFEQQI